MRRTKIVATIGPASREPAVLRRLIEAGVSVFRLNFSHGTHEEHAAVLADIRALSREAGRHVGVLQDLCGPKMRLGPLPGEFVVTHNRNNAFYASSLECVLARLAPRRLVLAGVATNFVVESTARHASEVMKRLSPAVLSSA